jgi:hypothetical protein
VDRVVTGSAVDPRRSSRQELRTVSIGLVAEFSGRVPAGEVLRCIARAREDLLRAGVDAGLAVAAESLARTRLLAIVPAHCSGA